MSSQPYIGLRPFERTETDIFFGREKHRNELIDRLGTNHFLAVIGTSGCGKSSLVKTGLIAGLEAGYLAQASTYWHIVEMRPGNQPFKELAEKLLFKKLSLEKKLSPHYSDVLAQHYTKETLQEALQKGSLSLHELLAKCPLPNNAQLLIVCDQFEEIFRYFKEGSVAEARNFVNLLLSSSQSYPLSATQQSYSIYIVITMRSDFLGECAKFKGLAEAINTGLYLTPRLNTQQLRAAIEEPAFVFDGEIEPTLVTRLLEDAENNQDQLPLLQHLLMRLWDVASNKTVPLTLTDYEAIGGLSNALSGHADKVYGNLPTEQQKYIAEILFRSLTERGDTQRDTRRPTPLAQIIELTGASQAEVVAVIDAFRQPKCCFLMPPINVTLNDESVIDISHESLIRQWKTLQTWTTDEADSAKNYLRLEDKATEWQKGKAGVLQSRELDIYLQWWQDKKPTALWAKRYGKDFALVEQFLSSSKQESKKSKQRKVIITTFVIVVLAVSTVIAIGYAIKANKQQREAERALGASNVMEANRRYEDGYKGQALAYLAKAVRLDPNNTAWRAALTSILLRNSWCPHKAELKSREPITTASFSSDGTKVLTIAGDEALLWNTANGKKIGLSLRHNNRVNSALFSPDSKLVVTASLDRRVRIWDSNTGNLKRELVRHNSPVKSASFTSDGARVVTKTDGEMRVFNATTGEEIGTPLEVKYLREDIFREREDEYLNEKYFLFRAKDKSVHVWSTEKGAQVGSTIANVSQIKSKLISADGRWLVIQLADSMRVISIDTGKDAFPPVTSSLKPEAFSDDGSTLLVSQKDFGVAVLDIETGKLGQVLRINLDQYKLSPDGKRLSVLEEVKNLNEDTLDSNENTLSKAYLWETTSWKLIGQPIENINASTPQYCSYGSRLVTVNDKAAYLQNSVSGDLIGKPLEHQSAVDSVAFSQDCKLLVTVANKEARLWDAQTGNPIGQPLPHSATVTSAIFSPDNKILVTISALGAHLWETKASASVGEMLRYGKNENIIKFSPKGNRVVTESDSKMQLRDTKTGTLVGKELESNEIVEFTSDGSKLLLATTEDNTARILDAENGLPLSPLISMPEEYLGYGYDDTYSLAISSKGHLLAGWSDRNAKLWDVNTGKRVGKLLRHNSQITSVTFSDDEKYIVTTSDDSTAKIWTTATGELVGKPIYHDGYKVSFASFDKKGERLLTIAQKAIPNRDYAKYERRIVRVWLTNTGRPLNEAITTEEEVTSASLSPDGSHILISSGNIAQIYDASTSAPIGDPLKHDENITSAEFNSDGSIILTVSGNNVMFWDAKRATRVGEVISNSEKLSDAYFLPNENQLVTISKTDELNTFRLWDIMIGGADDAQLIASAAEAIGGYSVSELSALHPVSNISQQLTSLRQSLETNVSEESSAHTMIRWLLSDPWERTVSPSAHLTVAEYIKNTIDAAHTKKVDKVTEGDSADNQPKDSTIADQEKQLLEIKRLYPGYSGLVSSNEQANKNIPNQKMNTEVNNAPMLPVTTPSTVAELFNRYTK